VASEAGKKRSMRARDHGAGGKATVFLVLALAGTALLAGVLVRDGQRAEALVVAAATVYFGLRLFGGLGRKSLR